MSLFKVAGVSTTPDGKTKVRFANDLIDRSKILIKCGHTNINLFDLPEAMTKPDVVKYLKGTQLMNTPIFAEAIEIADEKYNPTVTVTKISLDSIKSRAGIVT